MAAANDTTIEGMAGGFPGVRQFGLNTNQAVDFSGAPSVALPGSTTVAGAQTITSASASALVVGAAGATNPVLKVDASSGAVATGIAIKGLAQTFGVTITAISSGSNEALYLRGQGVSGAVHINDIVGDNIFLDGHIKILDAMNIVISGTTGTKIGDVATAKLSFYGATPIVQPIASTDATSFVAGVGTASKSDSTWTGASGSSAYTVGGIVTRLKALGLLAA